MPSFKLERYCCCCQLHTGGLIIGWVSVIYTIISLISSICKLNQVSDAIDEITELQAKSENSFNTKYKENQEVAATAARIFYGIYVAIIIMSIINLIPDIILIIGINKRNGKYLIPWLSIRALQYVICFIIILIIVFGFLPTSIIGIIFIFLLFAFITYHWLVIYSLCLLYMDNYDTHYTHNVLQSVAMKV